MADPIATGSVTALLREEQVRALPGQIGKLAFMHPELARSLYWLCDSWLAQQNLLREALGWMEGVEPRPAEPFLAEIRAALAREES